VPILIIRIYYSIQKLNIYALFQMLMFGTLKSS